MTEQSASLTNSAILCLILQTLMRVKPLRKDTGTAIFSQNKAENPYNIAT
jgi:hypothetical protein